ncbi:MAG TPA: hypothetical protein VFG41_09855 [Sphingomicrobium sp.]|nr:hypothetical protein [Sphingomicrobium sp.]
MITLIAAALAAAAPQAAPADVHAQHQQMAPAQGHQQHEAMKEDCCCKEMMEKHSGHDMSRMPDNQEHGGR